MKKDMALMLCMFCTLVFLSPDVYAQDSVLKAGIAKTDITPSESLYMGGYDSNMRDQPSDGAYGKIYIRALVFDNAITKVAFVICDLVDCSNHDEIRQSVSQATGIPVDNILLSSTHNHAAPVIGGPNKDSQWSRQFTGKVIETVISAMNDCEEVKIGGGAGCSNIAMNRRKKMEDTYSYLTFDENNSSQSAGKYKTDNPVKIREIAGVYRLGLNPDGPIDNEVGVIRIDTVTGKPKAVFINYAAHGTSLGGRNRTISPEWMGHMIEFVETEIPGVTGIFAQGACGDINPRFVGGLDGAIDSLENTAKLGHEIGKEVVRVYSGIKTSDLVDTRIKLVKKDIVCPLKYNWVMKDFKTTTVNVPVTVLKIDEFTWVTFPGELFHEIGKQIKGITHSRFSYLVAYCNGRLGYMPTQKAYSEGGYEPNSSRFAPVTEKVFVAGVKKILSELY